MIQDFDQTLEKIIYEQGKINRSDIDVSFEIPTGDWSARLNRPTIDLWCFDIRENTALRVSDPIGSMTRGEHTTRITTPPRRYDLCYIITAWVRKIEDEHQLLWRALAALAQVPLLPPEQAIGSVRDQPYDIPLRVANMPEFQMNITDLWSVVNNQMRLGFILRATLALDIGRAIEVPFVTEQRTEIGQAESPLAGVLTSTDGVISKKVDSETETKERGHRGKRG
ncbi:MAG TPA: Pvc16 family protein [Phototrophicaceae bacterium]|nr:Pvc16 family protein [Phototrophicaceae bacterium]